MIRSKAFSAVLPALLFLALSGVLLSEQIGDGRMSIAETFIKRRLPSATSTLRDLSSCPSAPAPKDELVRALAASIVASESSLRHPLETVYEAPVIWFGSIAGYNPPDLSLGPAQISPKHYAKYTGNLRGYWETVGSLCGTFEWTTRWVASLNAGDLEKADIRERLFAAWSGHLPSRAGEFETAAYFMFCESLFWRARTRLTARNLVASNYSPK